jgi:hypothetical protein
MKVAITIDLIERIPNNVAGYPVQVVAMRFQLVNVGFVAIVEGIHNVDQWNAFDKLHSQYTHTRILEIYYWILLEWIIS